MTCGLTDDEDERDIREGLDLGGNVVDVFLVQSGTVVGKRQFAVGGQSSAVTLWQVVDN